jgi:hypothetical protein
MATISSIRLSDTLVGLPTSSKVFYAGSGVGGSLRDVAASHVSLGSRLGGSPLALCLWLFANAGNEGAYTDVRATRIALALPRQTVVTGLSGDVSIARSGG